MNELYRNLMGIATMSGNYEQRVVANTKEDVWTVDTALVTDRSWLYETAVKHPNFRNGDWIVVDGTQTKEEAQKKHDEWVEKMKSNPEILFDIYEEANYSKR